MPWLVPNPSSPSAGMQALIKTSHARRSTKTAGSLLPLLENRAAHVTFSKLRGHVMLSWHIKCRSAIVQIFFRTVTWTHKLHSAHLLLRPGPNWMFLPHFLKLKVRFFSPMIPWYYLTSFRISWPTRAINQMSTYWELCYWLQFLLHHVLLAALHQRLAALSFLLRHLHLLVGLFISWWQVRPHVLGWLMTCCVAVQVIKHTIMA